MTDQRMSKFLRGLKQLVDEFEPGYQTHGPMRLSLQSPPSGKDAPWTLVVEAGWDWNFGGRLVIEASKTGKSLRVWRDGQELVATAKNRTEKP